MIPETSEPVGALPPCPTCDGSGKKYNDDFAAMGYRTPPCPACNGSGVERLVPLSEIVAWLRDPSDLPFHMVADGSEFAGRIERRFGGKHAD